MTAGTASRPDAPGVLVRYEDEHLAIVSKPAGIVVHRGAGVTGLTLVEALERVMPLAPAGEQGRPGIVHRLDKDTSGLLVVAKTEASFGALSDMIRAREISREYLSLVAGSFTMPRGRIEAPIGRSPKDPTRMAVRSGGRRAATNFKVLEGLSGSSFLEVSLETGRTHQIRVHLAHIKHPIVGDSVYGPATLALARALGLGRPFLHSARLRFHHPVTGDPVEVEEPMPSDLEGALSAARQA